MNQNDRNRLALRIEGLVQQSTYQWDHGDLTTFNAHLPNSAVRDPRRKLPSPERVRDADDFTRREYEDAIQKCLRMEGLVSDNRKGNVKRAMRDMARGRAIGWRR